MIGLVIDQKGFGRHSERFEEEFRRLQLSERFQKVLRRVLESIQFKSFEVPEALFLNAEPLKVKGCCFLLVLGPPDLTDN